MLILMLPGNHPLSMYGECGLAAMLHVLVLVCLSILYMIFADLFYKEKVDSWCSLEFQILKEVYRQDKQYTGSLQITLSYKFSLCCIIHNFEPKT